MTRVLAHAREAARTSEKEAQPFGAVAWHLLPALAVIVTLLVGVAGWQTREAQQRRVETIATLATSQGEGDLLPAVVFLGDATPEAGKAPRRRRSAPASPSFSSSWPDSCRARPRSSSIACSSSAASSSPRSRSLRAPSSILSLSRIKI